jgi:hypothetical protein
LIEPRLKTAIKFKLPAIDYGQIMHSLTVRPNL